MTSVLHTLWLVLSVFYGLLPSLMAQDIVFDVNENFGHLSGNKINLTEKIPVHIPGQCPPNQNWFPGPGTTSSWICDCIEGFLYFPLSDTCHEAYRQGPCQPGDFVVLPPNEVVPKCTHNPCHEDGLVPFRDTCYKVKAKGGPCGEDVLAVNATTFQLECVDIDLAPFVIIDAPKSGGCPIGSRRNAQGLCKVPI